MAGRPLKFKTVQELQDKIDQYFASCWGKQLDNLGNPLKNKETGEYVMIQVKPYTIMGLAVYLDCERETLLLYQTRKQFISTIKRAKDKCHSYAEEALFTGKNPAGVIFNLKNNYEWKDKMEQDINQTVRVIEDQPK